MNLYASFLLLTVLGSVCSAQILPREKREAALSVLAQLEPKPDDDFEARLANVTNPFRIGAPVQVSPDDSAPRPSADMEALLKREVRISGIFQLSDGRQSVFLNGRRFYVGDNVTLKLADRSVTLRVVSIESRRISVEVGGQTYLLPTR